MLNKMVELFALPLEHNGFELPENIIPELVLEYCLINI